MDGDVDTVDVIRLYVFVVGNVTVLVRCVFEGVIPVSVRVGACGGVSVFGGVAEGVDTREGEVVVSRVAVDVPSHRFPRNRGMQMHSQRGKCVPTKSTVVAILQSLANSHF